MADFNKIFINSTLLVNTQEYTSLGFNDGKLMSKTEYSIADHTLNILKDSYNTLSVFYNNGIANTYEYESRLYANSTLLPSQDLQGAQLKNPELNKTLLFINGELEPKTFSYIEDGHIVEQNTYDIIDNQIRINKSYTNNQDKLFNIILYTTTADFQRYTYTKAEISNLNLTSLNLPFAYEVNNTLLFINNLKVDFNAIESLNTTSSSSTTSTIKLNLDIAITDINSFEVIKFIDNNATTSINFISQQGYLSYGPYDYFNNKLSNKYDTILTFSDQAKILIDNIRQGFILKAVDGNGAALIVDDSFETPQVKALSISTSAFKYNNYLSNEFYLEVPEYTSITKYLAEYDTKYTFLPEILTVFQRVLLDDINDTIQRLRDARNINKVDSVHINKLISLLGFNANIKTLNKKQRQELLEELNEFYRIVGTRNSYNLVNILQNNLKLINAEQLFTPFGKYFRKDKPIYDYVYAINNPGHGYSINNVLATKYNTLLTVTDIYKPGDPEYATYPNGIKSFVINTQEGENIINVTNEPLVSPFTNVSIITINSVISTYKYTWNVESEVTSSTPGSGYYVGEELTTNGIEPAYKIKVTSVGTSGGNEGKILTYEKIGPYTDYGPDDIYKDKLDLYKTSELSINATISTVNTEEIESEEEITTLNEITRTLEPGIYKFELAGAGGSGAASDSGYSNNNDWPATSGANGELVTTGYVYLTEKTTLKGKIGQGGGKVKARADDGKGNTETARNSNIRGGGYDDGQIGELNYMGKNKKDINTYLWFYGAAVGGQGGGSTGITLTNSTTNLNYIAKGGNGGTATYYKGINYTYLPGSSVNSYKPKNYNFHESYYYGVITETKYSQGGLGGNGGISSGGNGGAGGARGDNSFWSKDGENGWLKITKYKVNYKLDKVQETGAVVVPDGESRNLLSVPNTYYHLDTIAVAENSTGKAAVNDEFLIDVKNKTNIPAKIKVTQIDTDGYIKTVSIIEAGKFIEDVSGSIEIAANDSTTAKFTALFINNTMTITKTNSKWYLSPTAGSVLNHIYLKTATYNTIGVTVTHHAILTINSTPYEYSYNNVNLRTNVSLLEVGNRFTTVLLDPDNPEQEIPLDSNHKFTCEITEINHNNNTFKMDYWLTDYPDKTDPSHYKNGIPYGLIPINTQYDAKFSIGSDATINIISSENMQKMEDRCYIDFYTKEECGAEKKTEFRENKIDYGDITIGTPNSPYWWIPGNPDIDYGSITQPITEFDEENDYGYITEQVEGKWVEWWEWDRKNIWYPTNHVNLEFKIPAGEDFTQYTNTFVEQFYNIASTVIFIHALVTSFYFGKDITASSDSQAVDNIGECFGIATGFPIVQQEYTVTSDPYIQNLSLWDGTEFDLTIIPYPSTATVEIRNVDTNQILATGIGETTVTNLVYNTPITYKVSANNYIQKTSHILIKHPTHIITRNNQKVYEICKYPTLEYIGNPTNNYHTLTINTYPANAKVEMTLNSSNNPIVNTITNETKTLTVMDGNNITATISCTGYVTQTIQYNNIQNNIIANITLVSNT